MDNRIIWKEKFGLTDRECDVAEMMMLGLDNGQVGEKLFVVTSTVKFHLGKVYEKTGLATSRGEGGVKRMLLFFMLGGLDVTREIANAIDRRDPRVNRPANGSSDLISGDQPALSQKRSIGPFE